MLNLRQLGHSFTNRYLSSLSFPDFRSMWLANLSAQAAAWGLIVVRGWLVFDESHSSAMVGTVTFAAMAPMFLVPPFAGVLADRMDRRTLLAWTFAINIAHNLLLAALAFTGALTLWQLVILSLVNGTARAVQLPVSQALVSNLVPREKLLNALSLTAVTFHGSRLIGPGLVTPLLGFLGAPAAFLLCTAFYVIGWVEVMRIRATLRGAIGGGERFIADFFGGLRYAWRHPIIRMIIVIVLFHCALTMAFESLLPHISEFHLNSGSAGFGILMMGVGAGALAGSLFIGGVQSGQSRGRLLFITGVASGLGQILLFFTHNMEAAVVAAVIIGSSQAAFMTLTAAVTQALADNEYRGRIASINTFSISGVMSVMNLGNGWLGNSFTPVDIMLLEGVVFIGVMAISVAVATPRRVYIRGIPAEAYAR